MRVLLGALVGGLVVFCWGAVSHMLLPLGEMGLDWVRDPAAETELVAAMKRALSAPGAYIIPGMAPDADEAAQEAWQAKYEAGPTAFLVFQPTGSDVMSPRQLGTELFSNVLAALLAALVLTRVRAGYVGRAALICLMGLFAWLSIEASYWNWYRFPQDYFVAAAIDQGVGWLFGGLALAGFVKGLEPQGVR